MGTRVRNLIVAIGALILLGGELAMAKSVTCTMASLERTVELRYDNPGDAVPCEVRYAKPTEGVAEQVLWRAEREAGYCEARFGEFVDKLTGFGWSCSEAAGDALADEPEATPEAVAEPAESDTEPEQATAEPDTPDARTPE